MRRLETQSSRDLKQITVFGLDLRKDFLWRPPHPHAFYIYNKWRAQIVRKINHNSSARNDGCDSLSDSFHSALIPRHTHY